MAAGCRDRTTRRSERGAAVVEAALVLPLLVVLLYWSIAMTDVLVLKIKSSEAVRFALWESTVFRDPKDIAADVAARFADLRSPASQQLAFTGLMLYPRSQDMVWTAEVDTTSKAVPIGGEGNLQLPVVPDAVSGAVGTVVSLISGVVDEELDREQFNVHGSAEARVQLVRASHLESAILNGGDLLGRRGGDDVDHARSMANWSFQTPLPGQRPMRLVFDTWKAWPKPAVFNRAGAPDGPGISPQLTYPVVERQVSAQVDKIAFLGLRQTAAFQKLSGAMGELLHSDAMRTMLGGEAPDILATGTMDGDGPRGPITILPVERPDVGWAPGGGLNVQRIGDVGTAREEPVWLRSNEALVKDDGGEDYSRYTVPFRINTRYWTEDGGMDGDARHPRLAKPDGEVGAASNGYVDTFHCRGHFFAGAVRAGVSDVRKRYRSPECN